MTRPMGFMLFPQWYSSLIIYMYRALVAMLFIPVHASYRSYHSSQAKFARKATLKIKEMKRGTVAVSAGWYTEERMRTELGWSALLDLMLNNACMF